MVAGVAPSNSLGTVKDVLQYSVQRPNSLCTVTLRGRNPYRLWVATPSPSRMKRVLLADLHPPFNRLDF